MNTLISMALKESLERLDVVSSNTSRTRNELEAIYRKHQEDIRTISSLISMAHNNKNTSENKPDMIAGLDKLMLSKQKDVAELQKMIDYATESSIEVGKARNWIKGTMEGQS
jgi:hypothetical protein